MRIVVLTPPNDVFNEHAVVEALFRKGLETLHVRKPRRTWAAFRNYLTKLPTTALGGVMIHDHHNLAKELKLKGVHYTEKTRPAKLPLRREGCARSTAFHKLSQLRAATQDYGCELDYAFLSPVFDSISKQGYHSAEFDVSETRDVLATLPFPVYALGGVEASNIQQVKELGFEGVAVLGAIWEAPDPIQAFLEIQAVCRKISAG